MDAVSRLVQEHRLDIPNIQELIDDYSIYSFYIGAELELHTLYSSPLRLGDDSPSFNLFISKYKKDLIMFKDLGTGQYGGVFKFVMSFLGLDLRATLQQINSDFELGLDGKVKGDFKAKIVKSVKLVRHETTIRITSREYSKKFFTYWAQYDISLGVLKRYFTKEVSVIHYENSDYKVTIVPKSLTMSYEIAGKYKLYAPTGERKYKFRNNFGIGFVEGLLQFGFKKDFALITKAMKEVMFFREHLDIDACAGTSENTMISEHVMNTHLKGKFKRVYIMLDSDAPGIKAQQKYLDLYPWLIPLTVPDLYNQKDITDIYTEAKKIGGEKGIIKLLKEMII